MLSPVGAGHGQQLRFLADALDFELFASVARLFLITIYSLGVSLRSERLPYRLSVLTRVRLFAQARHALRGRDALCTLELHLPLWQARGLPGLGRLAQVKSRTSGRDGEQPSLIMPVHIDGLMSLFVQDSNSAPTGNGAMHGGISEKL